MSQRPMPDIDPHTDRNKDTDKGVIQQSGLFVWTAKNLQAATAAVNGEWYADKNENTSEVLKELAATRIITDTRKINAGDIFLALIGDNFDGHDFIQAAADKGAIAAIVSTPAHNISIAQLKVDDTRLAFAHVATYRRQQHPNLKVIALTGSSGKTTVKEMLRSIFRQLELEALKQTASKDTALKNTASIKEALGCDALVSNTLSSTLVTRGNLNNDYGVPMMLLELSDHHQYAVLELGANHVGEIAYVADIVKPDVACVLNVGTAHLGEFGSRDNIAKTKAEIYQSLGKDGIAVIPAKDDYTEKLQQVARGVTENIIYIDKPVELRESKKKSMDIAQYLHNTKVANTEVDSIDDNAILNDKLSGQVFATNIMTKVDSSSFELNFYVNRIKASHKPVLVRTAQIKRDRVALPVMLPLAGEHNITNALAAAACAYAIGVTPQVIVEGLSQVASSKGRLYHQKIGQHHIIDDTYNANPDSVKAAADVLAAQSGTKILILGDIGELGSKAIDEHHKLGQAISQKPIDSLLCVGEFAKHTVAGACLDNNGLDNNRGLKAQAFNHKEAMLEVLRQTLRDEEQAGHHCTLLIKGSRYMAMETVIEDLERYLKA